jgi:16S rRNA (adenine1518-N6/adenine1519-N6)-dimethyltransferase
MLQKEVAQRLVSPPGNKAYGILSVFLQAYYKLEYLFDVPPQSFHPQPKVDSAVIRLQTLGKSHLECDEDLFRTLVKQGFQNRRKTLRNALKGFNLPQEVRTLEVMSQRAEQLSVQDYVTLTKTITPFWNQ